MIAGGKTTGMNDALYYVLGGALIIGLMFKPKITLPLMAGFLLALLILG